MSCPLPADDCLAEKFDVVIDREAAPGNVLPALARLLLDLARREMPETECNQLPVRRRTA
jgi:hypothetical protein